MSTEIESVESFRLRARKWLKENMPPAHLHEMVMGGHNTDEVELEEIALNRRLQRMLFDGGFAGICFPKEYGGQGLTPAHQDVFNEEIVGYQYPWRIQVPTFTPIATVILEFGTHEQKAQHIPAILKGEELWMQFLSEPGSGSDVAGATTTAVRDGDEWILNGSKIWTTGAWWSDWGLCLARTNPEVTKHRGLTVFMLPIHQPNIEVHRIEMLDGNKEFCQEFLTDVRVPDSDRVGDVDDGWTVGTRWMFYERNYGMSSFTTRPVAKSSGKASHGQVLLGVAEAVGRADDARVRELVGEGQALGLTMGALDKRLPMAMMTGALNNQAAAVGRLIHGIGMAHIATLAFDIAGQNAVTWTEEDESVGARGIRYIMRQAACIGGGTTEIARNVIAERVLEMPREPGDSNTPFREIQRSRTDR